MHTEDLKKKLITADLAARDQFIVFGDTQETIFNVALRRIEDLERTLNCIALNPEWNDHHCRAQAVLYKAI